MTFSTMTNGEIGTSLPETQMVDRLDKFAAVQAMETKRKEPYHNGKPQNDAKNRRFISCDMETYTPETDSVSPVPQCVMLFGFSCCENHYITGPDLTSKEFLTLIQEVAEQHAQAIFFGFGFKFDTNFLLKDLPKKVIVKIFKHDGGVSYQGIRYEFLQGKYLRISSTKSKGDPDRHKSWSITIYEVQNWFSNASLLDAYQAQIGEDEDYLFVAGPTGKAKRSEFKYEELYTIVLPYWKVEQRMYVRLMERMRKLVLDAGLFLPRAWYGPSALIARVYEKQNLKRHLRPGREEILDDEYIRACQRAYFGGRFEQFRGGFHDGPIYQYDIVSAYPAAMLELWSWIGTRYDYVDGNSLDRTVPMPAQYRFSVWDIRYTNRQRDTAFLAPMPFPHRMKSGAVLFPHATQTTVWSPELEMHWQNPDVEIIGGYVITPGTTERPFEFYGDLFRRRALLKRIGNPAQYAIKIAINSGYGKVAQRAGAKLTRKGWRIPPYHQLDWAGYITSHCRARIWRAIVCVGWKNVISVETDGIFTTKPILRDTLPVTRCTPSITLGEDLGQWESTNWEGMIAVQSGIYWLKSGTEWTKAKQRGLRRIGSKGITASDALAFLAEYVSDPTRVMISKTKTFHGIGDVLKPLWLCWTEQKRELTFAGTGKRQHARAFGGQPHKELVPLANRSLGFTRMEVSWPHPLPWSPYGDFSYKEMIDELELGEYTRW